MTGILDEYPGAAAAYSLRLLNTDYTGDAVIVRRASDNATTNIGFVDGDLDTAALDTFCTGTDGFVATWFDQSGNENNAVQTVAVEQPKVYDAVSGVILSNGKPSLYFDGTDNQIISNNLAGKARLDAYFVANTSDTSYLYPVGSLSSYGFFAGLSSFNTGINQGYGSPELYVNKLVFTGTTRNDVYDFLNGSKIVVHQNANTTSFANYNFGVYSSGAGINYTGYLSELIAYDSDQSSNRTGIEDNINNHYSIY